MPKKKALFKPIHKSSACPTGWYIPTNRVLGKGSFGKTYISCCENECKYVVKIQIDTPSAQREIEMQNLASNLGVGIPVIDSWSTEGYLAIIMPALKESIRTIFLDFRDQCIKNEAKCEKISMKVMNIIEQISEKIDILRKNRINHNDVKFDNIMVDDKNNIFIIDYGVSRKAETKESATDAYTIALRAVIFESFTLFSETPIWTYLKSYLPPELIEDLTGI